MAKITAPQTIPSLSIQNYLKTLEPANSIDLVKKRIKIPIYPRYKKDPSVTNKQQKQRSRFRECTHCWHMQLDGTPETPPAIGARSKQYWFAQAAGSGLRYYNYFMQRTLLAFGLGTKPEWCELDANPISLLLHFDLPSPEEPATDHSKYSHIVHFNKDATTTTHHPKFGERCLELGGHEDYLQIANHPSFDLAWLDFTLEAQVKLARANRGYQTIFSKWGTGISKSYRLYITGNTRISFQYTTNGRNSYTIVFETTLPVNEWFHLALTRLNNTLKLAINGTIIGTSPLTQTIKASPSALLIGGAEPDIEPTQQLTTVHTGSLFTYSDTWQEIRDIDTVTIGLEQVFGHLGIKSTFTGDPFHPLHFELYRKKCYIPNLALDYGDKMGNPELILFYGGLVGADVDGTTYEDDICVMLDFNPTPYVLNLSSNYFDYIKPDSGGVMHELTTPETRPHIASPNAELLGQIDHNIGAWNIPLNINIQENLDQYGGFGFMLLLLSDLTNQFHNFFNCYAAINQTAWLNYNLTRSRSLEGWLDEVQITVGKAKWEGNFLAPSEPYEPPDEEI